MKRTLLLIFSLILATLVFGQSRPYADSNLKNLSARNTPTALEGDLINGLPPVSPIQAKSIMSEEILGNTWFDLQSNAAMQNRLHLYEDGTIGAVYCKGLNHPGFDDRGTAYFYFDGSAWNAEPAPLESDRTGWPSYAPWGENGEIIVSHLSGASIDGLLLNRRSEKGTGTWTEIHFEGPEGYEDLLWPRMTTGGVDHTILHLVAITKPEANGGSIYEGQDGALLYSRSVDGGDTWEVQNYLFPELNSDYYVGIDGDTYSIQAQGDNVAILVGEPWIDMVLMKSTDGGVTWTKTIIWENPYPLWSGTVTDTFYCVDGAHDLAFDPDGRVHIAFGINRALSVDGTAQSWFPFVDGVGYWNEDLPTYSNNLHALDPYGHPDSELIDNQTLMGWSQDMDGDGEITFVGSGTDAIGTYQLGLSSMPQIHFDQTGALYVVWASVTETFDNGLKNYRKLWARASPTNGNWWGFFNHLTDELIHVFDESVWPVMSQTSDEDILLTFQLDSEPGLATRFEEHAYVENKISFMRATKYGTGVDDQPENKLIVHQNSPNPCSEQTTISIETGQPGTIEISVFNIVGQQVINTSKYFSIAGQHQINIDVSALQSGVYFYTIEAGNEKRTTKMIVD